MRLLIILLCTIIHFPTNAQNLNHNKDSLSYKFALKLNPSSIVVGAISICAELPVNQKNSIQLGYHYWTGFIPIWPIGRSFARFWSITGSYRHYLKPNSNRTYFYEPFCRITKLWEVNEYGNGALLNGKVGILTGGVLIGKRWAKNEKFRFEIFAGPYYSSPTLIEAPPFEDFRSVVAKARREAGPFNGLYFRAGVNIGYYFR